MQITWGNDYDRRRCVFCCKIGRFFNCNNVSLILYISVNLLLLPRNTLSVFSTLSSRYFYPALRVRSTWLRVPFFLACVYDVCILSCSAGQVRVGSTRWAMTKPSDLVGYASYAAHLSFSFLYARYRAPFACSFSHTHRLHKRCEQRDWPAFSDARLTLPTVDRHQQICLVDRQAKIVAYTTGLIVAGANTSAYFCLLTELAWCK